MGVGGDAFLEREGEFDASEEAFDDDGDVEAAEGAAGIADFLWGEDAACGEAVSAGFDEEG